MPKKTIYVKSADLEVWDKVDSLLKRHDSLSTLIVRLLKKWLAEQEK